MAASHGTRSGYLRGCRCDRCRHAQALYQQRYRERRANGETRPHSAPVVVAQLPPAELQPVGPGPVELAVESELAGLPAAQSRPAMSAIALAMSRILDGEVPTPKPGAAKVLVSVLDTLHKGSAQGRRGNLAVIREMTTKDGA
jgi:hypothetical protein